MRLIYTPEDAPPQEWSLRLSELLSPESEALEGCARDSWQTFDEFTDLVDQGNLKARRALLWILLRRENPKLRFVDLVVKVGETDLDYDDGQVADLRATVADESASEEDRESARLRLLATGRDVAEPAEQAALPEGEPAGKDEPDDSATDSP
jgi:hypothetical protein